MFTEIRAVSLSSSGDSFACLLLVLDQHRLTTTRASLLTAF